MGDKEQRECREAAALGVSCACGNRVKEELCVQKSELLLSPHAIFLFA